MSWVQWLKIKVEREVWDRVRSCESVAIDATACRICLRLSLFSHILRSVFTAIILPVIFIRSCLRCFSSFCLFFSSLYLHLTSFAWRDRRFIWSAVKKNNRTFLFSIDYLIIFYQICFIFFMSYLLRRHISPETDITLNRSLSKKDHKKQAKPSIDLSTACKRVRARCGHIDFMEIDRILPFHQIVW